MSVGLFVCLCGSLSVPSTRLSVSPPLWLTSRLSDVNLSSRFCLFALPCLSIWAAAACPSTSALTFLPPFYNFHWGFPSLEQQLFPSSLFDLWPPARKAGDLEGRFKGRKRRLNLNKKRTNQTNDWVCSSVEEDKWVPSSLKVNHSAVFPTPRPPACSLHSSSALPKWVKKWPTSQGGGWLHLFSSTSGKRAANSMKGPSEQMVVVRNGKDGAKDGKRRRRWRWKHAYIIEREATRWGWRAGRDVPLPRLFYFLYSHRREGVGLDGAQSEGAWSA